MYSPRDEKQCVYQYRYLSWPDKTVPKETDAVVQFLCDVSDKQASFRDAGPVVVHCRSDLLVHFALMLLFQHCHLLQI